MPTLRISPGTSPRSTVPTRIGTPIAVAAAAICWAASGLRSGSMSLEFSGQTTRSGCGCRPAATSAASCWVARTWLSSTARRWALKSRPRRGTLPCTIATVTAVPRPGRATGSQAGPATSNAPHAPAIRPRGAGADRAGATASATRTPPAAATAKVTSGAPPNTASRSPGASPWLNASRPHGNPPNGARSRSASCAIQSRPISQRPQRPPPVGQRRQPRRRPARAAPR